MFATAKKLARVVSGNRTFQEPALEYVGADSVLRLGVADHREFLSDIAGGGHLAGYGVWQGAPSNVAYMLPAVDMVGGGANAGTGRQPGQLLNLNALDSTSPMSTGV